MALAVRRWRLAPLTVSWLILLLSSCARQPAATSPSAPTSIDGLPAATPLTSETGGAITISGPIVIADYPGVLVDPIELEWNSRLAELLGNATGVEFVVVKPTTFAEILDGLEAGSINIASLPPVAYLVAKDQGWGDAAFFFSDPAKPDLVLTGVQFMGDSRAGMTPGQGGF